MCVCASVCVRLCTCVVYMYMRTCVHVFVCLYVCVFVYVCTHECSCVLSALHLVKKNQGWTVIRAVKTFFRVMAKEQGGMGDRKHLGRALWLNPHSGILTKLGQCRRTWKPRACLESSRSLSRVWSSRELLPIRVFLFKSPISLLHRCSVKEKLILTLVN